MRFLSLACDVIFIHLPVSTEDTFTDPELVCRTTMTVLEFLMLVHVFDVRVPLEKEGNELFRFEGVAGQLGG